MSATGHSLQIVGRRESLRVCNAPKADAKSEPWRLSRRVTVVIAVPPACPGACAAEAVAGGLMMPRQIFDIDVRGGLFRAMCRVHERAA